VFEGNDKETNKFAYEAVEKDWQSAYFKLKNTTIVYVKIKRRHVKYFQTHHKILVD
tara:strand:+ start:875 stop:1042 length:168 start_codon:yes stop_codon:yes gene_type:complete